MCIFILRIMWKMTTRLFFHKCSRPCSKIDYKMKTQKKQMNRHRNTDRLRNKLQRWKGR